MREFGTLHYGCGKVDTGVRNAALRMRESGYGSSERCATDAREEQESVELKTERHSLEYRAKERTFLHPEAKYRGYGVLYFHSQSEVSKRLNFPASRNDVSTIRNVLEERYLRYRTFQFRFYQKRKRP
ncbi:hypothetical protein BIY21_05560 [Vibrio ponticus]|uniref:Uncharacterized protein n=1 Tax=Vibrio ponticus TaxID=265668 RepID=A0ABX3FN95_9VIBR|nr:hypothetical protein BIY21_05560 [Vibrio ponticus]